MTTRGRSHAAAGLGPLPDVAAALHRLTTSDTAALQREWQRWHGTPAPACFSRDLLQRDLAHSLQEREFGAAPRRNACDATRSTMAAGGPGAASAPRPSLKPGTTFVREWHGKTHTVQALADGAFEHAGRRYRSLSEIARAITGARWSGPRFFGLRRQGTGGRQASGG